MHSHAQAFPSALDKLVVPCHESPGPRYPRPRRSDRRVHGHTLRSRPTHNRHGCSDLPECAGPAANSHCEHGTAPGRVCLEPLCSLVPRPHGKHSRSFPQDRPEARHRRSCRASPSRVHDDLAVAVSSSGTSLYLAARAYREKASFSTSTAGGGSYGRETFVASVEFEINCGVSSRCTQPPDGRHAVVGSFNIRPFIAVAMMVEGALETPTSIGMKS